MNFVAIDFETANFKRQSICSVGLAIVEDFKVVKTINKFIKPTPNYYEKINMSIHGIKPDMTENEKNFSELWPELKPYLEINHVVAHNASFDFSALRYTLDTYKIEYPRLNYYCSMQISKKLYSGLLNYQLPTVCNLSVNRLSAFQHVGNCSGFGHDYDNDEVSNTDYFIIADKQILDLKNGIKNQSIIDFENVRNSFQQGDLKSVKLISETTFLAYIERRLKFQKGDIKMNIYESEIKE